MNNGRQRLPVIEETLARFHLLVHKGLVHASNQRVVLVEKSDLHPERVLYQDRPLSLDFQFCSILGRQKKNEGKDE